MDMSDRGMDLVRAQIAAQQKAIPHLHERATDLGLMPQPWWSRSFYEHAIQRREAELEAQEDEVEEDPDRSLEGWAKVILGDSYGKGGDDDDRDEANDQRSLDNEGSLHH